MNLARGVLTGSAAFLAATALAFPAFAAPSDKVIAEIAPNHDESIERL